MTKSLVKVLCKIDSKYLQEHKNGKRNKHADDEMIRSQLKSIIKKEILNPNNNAANFLAPSATSDTT